MLNIEAYLTKHQIEDRVFPELEPLQFLMPSSGPSPLNYREVLSLAIALAPRTEWDIWDVIRLQSNLSPQDNQMLDYIVNGVFNYYRDVRSKELVFYSPSPQEKEVYLDLIATVRRVASSGGDLLEQMTAEVYECGKRHFEIKELRRFFAIVYGFMLGQEDGPRLPNFIVLYGADKFSDHLQRLVDEFYVGS